MTSLRVLRVTFCLMLATLLAGCGTIAKLAGNDDKGHAIYDRQGLDFLVEDASKKTTIIKDNNSLERFCRSPNPDFASGTSSSVTLGLTHGPSIGTGSGVAIDALGGRSPAVLLTRELMYRACELALNLNANEALTKEIYWKFLSTIEFALKNQTGAGSQGSTVSTSSSSAPPGPNPLNSPSGLMPYDPLLPGGPTMPGGPPWPGAPLVPGGPTMPGAPQVPGG